MPRGRKPTPPATPTAGPFLDEQAAQAVVREAGDLLAHQADIVNRFGDGLPWQPDHYEAEIRGELRRGCDAFLRAGRLLVVARECANHGEWHGMLERLGISQPQAHRMMEAARRIAGLGNVSTSRHLAEAAGSQSKLIELLSLPEDQFTELATEGATGGLALDDIAGMTVGELRAAVREARADLEAKDERAAARERELERLTSELRAAKRLRSKATPADDEKELREQAQLTVMGIRALLIAEGDGVDSLRMAFRRLFQLGEETGQDQRDFMAGLAGEVLQLVRIVRDEYGLPIVGDHGAPDWMRGA